MPSNFWIKLYHEILHDPKMGMLPDNVWRRAIELFLLAGELDKKGNLPDTQEIAWLLRQPNLERFEAELEHLERVNILTRLEHGWLVTKFAERQAAIGDAERAKAYRDRKRKQEVTQESNEAVTPELQERHASVTNRDADIDKDILPKGNSGKPQSASRENAEGSKETLLPNTPETRVLFAKINRNRSAKDHNQARRFGSLEQKEKCLAAARRLGYQKFLEGVEAGLTNGITDLKGLVNWIAKWSGSSQNGNHQELSGASPQPSAPIDQDKLKKLQQGII